MDSPNIKSNSAFARGRSFVLRKVNYEQYRKRIRLLLY